MMPAKLLAQFALLAIFSPPVQFQMHDSLCVWLLRMVVSVLVLGTLSVQLLII
jgi:hypothetical protein